MVSEFARSAVGLSGMRTKGSGVEGWRTRVTAENTESAEGNEQSTLKAIRKFVFRACGNLVLTPFRIQG